MVVDQHTLRVAAPSSAVRTSVRDGLDQHSGGDRPKTILHPDKRIASYRYHGRLRNVVIYSHSPVIKQGALDPNGAGATSTLPRREARPRGRFHERHRCRIDRDAKASVWGTSGLRSAKRSFVFHFRHPKLRLHRPLSFVTQLGSCLALVFNGALTAHHKISPRQNEEPGAVEISSWSVQLVTPNRFEGRLMLDLLTTAGVARARLVTDSELAIGQLARAS